jgi:hypothetical protein
MTARLLVLALLFPYSLQAADQRSSQLLHQKKNSVRSGAFNGKLPVIATSWRNPRDLKVRISPSFCHSPRDTI